MRHAVPNAFTLTLALVCAGAQAQPSPSVAVTDLAYTVAVQQYFEAGTYKNSATLEDRSNATLTTDRRTITATAKSEGSYVAGSYSYIEQRELGSFTNDIKGAILKGTTLRLVQPKTFDAGAPQPTKAEQALNQIQTGKMAKLVHQPEVRDIIDRIRKGEFKGADYVLFGTLTSIQFRDTVSAIQGTGGSPQNAAYASHIYSLDLVADFSLISTKTFEIKAAFSAQGAGAETKLLTSRGDVLPPNRGKVMRDTSKTLAGDVFAQLAEQLALAEGTMGQQLRPETEADPRPSTRSQQRQAPAPKEEVTILR
jgi:hypothetical protein